MTGTIISRLSDVWSPPVGMLTEVAQAWREFYRKGLTGKAGYVIRPAEYRLLYIAQKGRCWICRRARGVHPDDPKGRGGRRLGVDHNHVTGAVRGLLCTGGDKTCNRLLGWLRDDPRAFERAAQYLREPPARVLAEMAGQLALAADEDYEPPQRDMDRLAVAFLWRGERDDH